MRPERAAPRAGKLRSRCIRSTWSRPTRSGSAVEIIRADPRFEAGSVFAHVRLYEPAKDAAPEAVEREIEALLVPPDARLEAIEVVVSVTAREIRSWTVREGARPALLFGESLQAMLGVQAHPDWQAALRRRGIEDLSQVQIDPWPAGSFGVAHEDGRRISRCIAYLRETPSDNGYARPIEGLIAFFDQGAGEVLEVVDLGVVPMPPERGSYLPADVGPMRDDLRPLEIVQPDGASFHVEGNHVRWQRWSFRVGFDPYEGLTLHTVGYHDGDRAAAGAPPGIGVRDGRPVRRSGRDARVEERVRRRRVGPRPDGEFVEARDATASASCSTSTRCSRPSRASRTRWSTRSACTKRTTASSGSTRTSAAAPTRCGGRAGSW